MNPSSKSGIAGMRREVRDPTRGPMVYVAILLAHFFQEEYQFRSLNAYWPVIPSVHEKMDGKAVDEHCMIP